MKYLVLKIQLLSLLFHLLQLTILYILGWFITYTLYIIQRIYLKYAELFGEITSPRIRHIYKEIDFFYIQVLPTFFSNLSKERYLTISSIETLYINLPIIFRILVAFIFTFFVIYCILLVISYLYYTFILH
jgi:hypothetical protein